MYVCCYLDVKIHVFATTQRDGPYQKKNREVGYSKQCAGQGGERIFNK